VIAVTSSRISPSRTLNAGRLPDDYYALAEQVAGGFAPDVLTLEHRRDEPEPWEPDRGGESAADDSDGVALAAAPPKVRFTAACPSEAYARRRSRIAVRHRSGDRVVAIVEIVSPGNKASQHAMRSFVEKSVELLESGIHLLLLDLFPPGPRDPQGIHGAIWSEIGTGDFQLPPGEPLTMVAYSVGEMKRAFIEPAAVGATLPEMPVFLEPELYVPLPLEPTYQAAFEAVPRRWRDELVG